MPEVRLAIGSNAASVWWVNGAEMIGLYHDRQTVIDDSVSMRLTLKQGANVIRAATINGGAATDFCARFLDAEGRPVKTTASAFTSGTEHNDAESVPAGSGADACRDVSARRGADHHDRRIHARG
jgi:hypothetical protein